MRLGRERPRKRHIGIYRIPTGLGFNEAGARTPQKEAGRRRDHLNPQVASMRLGRERPRKGKTPQSVWTRFAGFNEAGARTPQKGPKRNAYNAFRATLQ